VPWVREGRAGYKEGRQDVKRAGKIQIASLTRGSGGCRPSCRAPAVATLTVQSIELNYIIPIATAFLRYLEYDTAAHPLQILDLPLKGLSSVVLYTVLELSWDVHKSRTRQGI
jgi:hypothetical protein